MKTLTSLEPIGAQQYGHQATLLAAEAVLATLSGRAAGRIVNLSLAEGRVRYTLALDSWALQNNRALLEDAVMTALAPHAAARLLELDRSGMPGSAVPAGRGLLLNSLKETEELEVIEAYLTVLEARTRAMLRQHWSEVQVVAAGLRESGVLSGEDIRHRIQCAQGIRATLLN